MSRMKWMKTRLATRHCGTEDCWVALHKRSDMVYAICLATGDCICFTMMTTYDDNVRRLRTTTTYDDDYDVRHTMTTYDDDVRRLRTTTTYADGIQLRRTMTTYDVRWRRTTMTYDDDVRRLCTTTYDDDVRQPTTTTYDDVRWRSQRSWHLL